MPLQWPAWERSGRRIAARLEAKGIPVRIGRSVAFRFFVGICVFSRLLVHQHPQEPPNFSNVTAQPIDLATQRMNFASDLPDIGGP